MYKPNLEQINSIRFPCTWLHLFLIKFVFTNKKNSNWWWPKDFVNISASRSSHVINDLDISLVRIFIEWNDSQFQYVWFFQKTLMEPLISQQRIYWFLQIELRRAYNCEIMLTKVKVPLRELVVCYSLENLFLHKCFFNSGVELEILYGYMRVTVLKSQISKFPACSFLLMHVFFPELWSCMCCSIFNPVPTSNT